MIGRVTSSGANNMRIGVMMQTIDEKQGIGVVSQNLMNQQNEYVRFYRHPDFPGRYAHYDHVSERLVTAPKCVGNNVA